MAISGASPQNSFPSGGNRLAGTQDEVHPTLRVDNVTDLPNAQRKRRLFERLLHLARTEPAQVAIMVMR